MAGMFVLTACGSGDDSTEPSAVTATTPDTAGADRELAGIVRELRQDPTLRGQLVLRLTIEPDGSVSMCELHSSSMDAPQLAAQVVERVKLFDFGAKEDIVAITIIYPIDFLPAA